MGTLDDAIREHLELKKRSGASEEEVRRLESEAFGPVRREPAAPPSPEPPEPEPEPEPSEDEDPPAARAAGEWDDRQEAPEPEVPPVPPVAPPDPFLPTPPPAPARSWLEDDPEERGPQSTREFTAADAEDAQGRPPADYVPPDEEGEDLLEETPDFLQETPEHDRLWFEQRPPRDFDFDE